MTDEEKRSLMILLMEDLRGSWGRNAEERSNRVRELAVELGYSLTVTLCDQYTENIREYGNDDGRHFRCDFTDDGGYENPPFEVHREIEGRSNEFVEAAGLMNNPGSHFDDWADPEADGGVLK